MIFNFLSPPKVGGDYRGGFLALLTARAEISSNFGALLSPLPTSPRPPPSEEGGVNSMIFNFLSPPKVGGDYRGGFLALLTARAEISSNIGTLPLPLPTSPRPHPSEGGGVNLMIFRILSSPL